MWVSISNIFDVKVIVQKILHTIAEKPEDHVWNENPHK